MMNFLFYLLDVLLIKSWLWLLKMFWYTLKYMVMDVVALFVGVPKTAHRLAVSNTQRKTGMPYDVTPDLFKVEKTKVIAWMVWAYLYWLFVIGMVVAGYLTNGVN